MVRATDHNPSRGGSNPPADLLEPIGCERAPSVPQQRAVGSACATTSAGVGGAPAPSARARSAPSPSATPARSAAATTADEHGLHRLYTFRQPSPHGCHVAEALEERWVAVAAPLNRSTSSRSPPTVDGRLERLDERLRRARVRRFGKPRRVLVSSAAADRGNKRAAAVWLTRWSRLDADGGDEDGGERERAS